MYGEGVSKMGEILDLGVKAGIVEKSGAWFSYDSQRLGQGRENSKAFLKANPDMTAKIEAAIRQNSGLIANRFAGSPSAMRMARRSRGGLIFSDWAARPEFRHKRALRTYELPTFRCPFLFCV